ncbi:uncharacterized protein LOC143245820 [Tachypleus tridentatus]|uniref:uncharacterized protein LOC143245820 n=1 Tax=Tachypleus tridentatus TaxID=6853 RepID=UPI003FD6B743
MRLSRSDNKSKDTQKELTQLVHEASHDNSGIDVSVIHSVNMVSSTEELSAQKDSTVLSDSLEKIKSVSSGNKTGITQKEYSCKGLCGLGMEDKSDNIIQKARFGTVPESEILGSKSTESLNIDTKSRTDCTENKSEQKLNTTCIQEEKQHSMLEKNCSVRHHASPIRYPDVSSSSDELVSFASFKQSFGEELHKKFQTLLQELVSPEQLRSRPFKWRNSDLGSPDIIPLNNSPETDFVLSPVGRSEKFSFDTTWPNLKHEKRLMMTTPGPYTPTQKVQFQGNDKLSKMKATVEPDYIHNAKKNRSSSVISSQESVLKRKYSSLQNEPQLSHMGGSKEALYSRIDTSSHIEHQVWKKQQSVDRPVNNYWRTNFVFSDVKSEIAEETLEEQVKTLSKKYVNTVQRCISTFRLKECGFFRRLKSLWRHFNFNQLVEYRKQVSDAIASITGESHTTFQVDSDLLTYLKESKDHMLKVVHKLVKLEETVHLLRLAENKLEKKLQEIQKKATIKYQQQLQQVIEESFKEMEKSMLKQLHHLSAFNLFI